MSDSIERGFIRTLFWLGASYVDNYMLNFSFKNTRSIGNTKNDQSPSDMIEKIINEEHNYCRMGILITKSRLNRYEFAYMNYENEFLWKQFPEFAKYMKIIFPKTIIMTVAPEKWQLRWIGGYYKTLKEFHGRVSPSEVESGNTVFLVKRKTEYVSFSIQSEYFDKLQEKINVLDIKLHKMVEL